MSGYVSSYGVEVEDATDNSDVFYDAAAGGSEINSNNGTNTDDLDDFVDASFSPQKQPEMEDVTAPAPAASPPSKETEQLSTVTVEEDDPFGHLPASPPQQPFRSELEESQKQEPLSESSEKSDGFGDFVEVSAEVKNGDFGNGFGVDGVSDDILRNPPEQDRPLSAELSEVVSISNSGQRLVPVLSTSNSDDEDDPFGHLTTNSAPVGLHHGFNITTENVSDKFDDFEAAETGTPCIPEPPPTDTVSSEIIHDKDTSDSFGAFEGPVTESNDQSNSKAEFTQQRASFDSDLFVGCHEGDNILTHASVVKNNDHDIFSGFETTPALSIMANPGKPQPMVTESSSSDPFDMFHNIPVAMSHSFDEKPAVQPLFGNGTENAISTDSFDAFNDVTEFTQTKDHNVEAHLVNDVVEQNPTLVPSDPFGVAENKELSVLTFNEIGNEKEKIEAAFEVDASGVGDDEFGVFEGIDVSDSPKVVVAADDYFGTNTNETISSNAAFANIEENHDNVGAFEGISSFDANESKENEATDRTTIQDDVSNSNCHVYPASTADHDESFGDFDSAQHSEATTNKSKEPDALDKAIVNDEVFNRMYPESSAEQEESFGDPDTSQPSETIPNNAVLDPAKAQKGEFPAENEVNEDEFGDFGDFDSAPLNDTPVDKAEPLLVSSEQNDDAFDDDDFGDFGEATAVEEPSTSIHVPSVNENNDFGDFSSFPDETPASETKQSIMTVEDPVMNNIRNTFPKIFSRYSLDLDVENRSEPVEGIVTVSAVLQESIDQKKQAPQSVQSHKSIIHLLRDASMLNKKPSNLIIHNGGKGPFDHTRYPVGGFKSLKNNTQSNHKDVGRKSHKILPELLNIQLPSASTSSKSSTQSANVVVKSVTDSAAPTETIVNLPPTPSNKNGAAISSTSTINANGNNGTAPTENVKDFLKKIPDLSFMLSSKLSLPNMK